LLRALQKIEDAAGRIRGGVKWGPRVLDLDLLIYDDLALDTPELKLPHPHLHERNFVLAPLAQIAPGLVIPGRGEVGALLRAAGKEGLGSWPA
jgi:2-amino-4-hydroxy-6-hydroxymethyldihydropteridine diphosphokinase